MIVDNEEKIYRDAFGHWITALFSAISGNNPGISFEEHKEVFFELLRKWLGEGKIVFCTPEDPLNTNWETDSDTIIAFLKSHWPDGAKDRFDSDLNVYFYEMPAVAWVGDDGKLYSS